MISLKGETAGCLSLFIIFALIIGTARILLDAEKIFDGSIDSAFEVLVSDILGMIVALELFTGMMDYMEVHRVRLTVITDVTLVFILREVMVSLYQHKLVWQDILSMSILIAVLGGLRTMAILRSPGTVVNKE